MAPLTAAVATGLLTLTATTVCTASPSKEINMLRDPDISGDGGCLNGEQYNRIESISTLRDNFDYYTLTWRQVTDACGEPISATEAAVFTGEFTQGEVKFDRKGRDQLIMSMCSPYGYYELEIVIVGGREGATGAIHWKVELGPSQREEEYIWDTWDEDEYRIPKYNPSGPGTYTFPLKGEKDPHMAKIWAGPKPGMENCENFGVISVGAIHETGKSTPPPSSGRKMRSVQRRAATATETTGRAADNELGDDFARGATVLGCFEDDSEDSVLGGFSDESEMMDAEFCSEVCEGYDYFGTKAATQCYCGNTAPTKKSDGCIMACAMNNDVACGGLNAITVFERNEKSGDAVDGSGETSSSTVESSGGKLLGCYRDSTIRPVLAQAYGSHKMMTPEFCVAFCQEQGATFSGVQGGTRCFCGDSFEAKKAINEKCNVRCGGDKGKKCGGTNFISIYQH